jgi:predicted metal-dependent peptidase
MNALDRIKKAKVSIMRHKKFCAFSGILACGDWVIDDTIPTACTSGWGARFNSDFVTSLTDPELRLLVLHEGCHVAFQHLTVWRDLWKEHRKLANIAADHFVNLSLTDTDAGEGFIKMPKVGIQPEERFRGMSVKQIYDVLKAEKREKRKKEDGDEPGDEPGDGDEPGEGEGIDSHDWEGANEGQADAKEAETRANEIQRAIRQGESLRKKIGKGAGGADGVFGDLLAPKVDWRKVLREFVTENCAGRDESTWRRPNRRYLADDIYMPSMEGMTMAELVIVFDTSGSCFGGAEMARFVTELASVIEMVKPGKCHVLYTDTEVAGHQVFEDGQFAVQSLKAKGGGGTDLPVAFDYCKDKGISPTACIVLTDMFTPFGNPPGYPVLWASTSTGIRAPYGTTIEIGD